jgi:hypothetical protein
MNSFSPIGGYFGLEQGSGKDTGGFLHDDAILLNTARNCFEYILRANKVTHVYMPKFTCDVMLEPLQKLDISYTFYSINDELEITSEIELGEGEYIVYTNYFGIKDKYSRYLSGEYGEHLILDCSQAYYFEPLIVGHTIYSPRKFFGVPDGGCLYTGKILSGEFKVDISDDRMSHLFKRIEKGAEAGYGDYLKNDASLVGQPIKQMSATTKTIMTTVGFEEVRQKRIDNFRHLHEVLDKSNEMDINTENITCPMIYPFKIKNKNLRQSLIDKKIFVATYWPNVFEWCSNDEVEYHLAQDIIPLPIDQRYGKDDMERIIGIISGS